MKRPPRRLAAGTPRRTRSRGPRRAHPPGCPLVADPGSRISRTRPALRARSSRAGAPVHPARHPHLRRKPRSDHQHAARPHRHHLPGRRPGRAVRTDRRGPLRRHVCRRAPRPLRVGRGVGGPGSRGRLGAPPVQRLLPFDGHSTEQATGVKGAQVWPGPDRTAIAFPLITDWMVRSGALGAQGTGSASQDERIPIQPGGRLHRVPTHGRKWKCWRHRRRLIPRDA